MKTVLLIAVLLSVVPAAGFTADIEAGLEGRTLYRLQVDGMVCPFCAYSVEQRLQAVAGVEYVDVDVESGRVLVGVQPGHRLEETQIRKLIEEAGFRFEGLERRPMTREELESPE